MEFNAFKQVADVCFMHSAVCCAAELFLRYTFYIIMNAYVDDVDVKNN